MFPKRKDRFVAWSRAMVEGATVDKPNYSSKKARTGKTPKRQRRGSYGRRRKRNAKKD